MTGDIVINIDEDDSKFFTQMGGKEGRLYVKISFDRRGDLATMVKLYLDGTVSEDYVTVVKNEDGTYKFLPEGRMYDSLKDFGDSSYECELFCNDQYDGIGEKNLLLHLL